MYLSQFRYSNRSSKLFAERFTSLRIGCNYTKQIVTEKIEK